MKKVRFLSVLMAAIIASAPATGLTSNVLPYISNTITASAADYRYVTIYTGQSRSYKINGKTSLIRYGSWTLTADSSGEFYIEGSSSRKYFRVKNNYSSAEFHNPYNEYSVYPKLGGKIMINSSTMRYSINLQDDGNLVAYSNSDTKKPLWHTNSYFKSITRHDYTLSRNPGYKALNYKYELTSDGRLLIICHYYLNGRIGDITIWDSSKDYIYRVV